MIKKIKLFFLKTYQRRFKTYNGIFKRLYDQLPYDFWISLYHARLSNKWAKSLLALVILQTKNNSDQIDLVLDDYLSKDRKISKYLCYLLSNKLTNRRKYNSQTERLVLKSIAKNAEITANFRAHDFFTQVYGYKSPKLRIIIQRLKSRKIYPLLTKAEKCKLMILLFQHGKDEAARAMLKDVGYRFIENHYPSLYLINKLRRDKEISFFFSQGSHIYRNVLKNRRRLEQHWRAHKKEICVIGNSPCELGTGNGPLINNYKYPIRINEYSLEYEQDYGKNEHTWIKVANQEVVSKNFNRNKFNIIASNNFVVKRRDAYAYLLPLDLSSNNYTVIPSYVFRDLIKILGGLPSTGLAVLYWVYSVVGPLSKEQVFGFSHFTQARDFKSHYYNDIGEIENHLHVWDEESILMQKMVDIDEKNRVCSMESISNSTI